MNWLSITVTVTQAAAEPMSEALSELGALSVTIEDAHAGTESEHAVFGEPGSEAETLWPHCQITALFPEAAAAGDMVRLAAAAAGLASLPQYAVATIAEQDWVRHTQAQFEPIRISARLWIVPTWHQPVDANAINLALDPGVAFGTGSHPTTRLCLEWLDAHLRGGETVLDYGCGSGILAIAALKLGAGSALGVDIDPLAVTAARANAAQNHVPANFCLPDSLATTPVDIAVANILANPLKVLAPLLASHTRPGGQVVLSGVLSAQADEVCAAYRPWFDMAIYRELDNWVCLTGVKRPP